MKNCNEQVARDYGIKLEDLETLPYKRFRWRCLVPGCTRGTHVRDYGIAPFYFCERKGWGWIDGTIYYMMCGPHWKQRDRVTLVMAHKIANPEYLMGKFEKKEIKGKK